jgi:hypothetical protein
MSEPSNLYLVRKQLSDGRVVEVIPLTFFRARIVIGDGVFSYDDGW